MKRFALLALLAACLAYGVVVLGAYVRLSDAGLGCPDWPVCYGRIIPPTAEHEIHEANTAFPQRPFEGAKAWKEQIHRYAATTLGLLIVLLAGLAWRSRRDVNPPFGLAMFLVGLVIFQGLLGMWTVTLLLKPLFVMLHLLGGMTTLLLLWWLVLKTRATTAVNRAGGSLHILAAVTLTVLYLQIALGGWTSSNYAALACTDFPRCHGSFWPTMDFKEAFVLWRGLGINYEFGVLETPARTAIHFTHRIGALLTSIVVVLLALACMRSGVTALLRAGAVLLVVLGAQLALGIANVVYGLPLPVAVAHNGGAALLLLTVGTVLYFAGQNVHSVASLSVTASTGQWRN